MRTPPGLRTIAYFLVAASIGAGAIVMAPLHAQTAPGIPAVRPMTAPAPGAATASAIDPQILALQAQIASLQAQLNAMAAAVRVTPTGLVLQGPTVTIVGSAISIQSQSNLVLRVGQNVNLEIGGVTSLTTGADLKLSAGGAAVVAGTGTLDLRGSSVRFNGGSKPVALLGSAVANGQILSGSPSVFAN
jgi:hypothetical protein